ncbi:MAG: molybdenum cofactor biosynthesis protein [Calditrichaeota bacterium]|nr:molybdenum cofactor biosynthesis protein [Calditrichota bacterium]
MSVILQHICISETKGTVKHPVASAVLIENYGLENDAHAGDWHRQVSLLDEADIDTMRDKGLQLDPGAFGENLIIEGLDLSLYGHGTKLGIGETVLEITQIGKVCHTRCAIYFETGDCIMPKSGLFAQVTKGGVLSQGLEVEVLSGVPRRTIQTAVLTVSDTCSSGDAIDTAGPAVSEMIETSLEARIAWHGIVADNSKEMKEILKDLSSRHLDLILTVGGTGCAERDITPEATRAVIEKEVPGLAEAMRLASMQVTPHAMLQRGICGILGSTLIVNLPGSKKAATENLQVILPAIPHAIRLLRGDTSHNESESRVK